MRILIFLVMFLILGALFIISDNNLAMVKKENSQKFYQIYLGWTNKIYSNLKSMTGNVIRMDWFPE